MKLQIARKADNEAELMALKGLLDKDKNLKMV
jgi:hypothetical protein